MCTKDGTQCYVRVVTVNKQQNSGNDQLKGINFFLKADTANEGTAAIRVNSYWPMPDV